MQRTKIKSGLEVYRVKRTYTWDNLGENPDECRAVVVDTDRWAIAPNSLVRHYRHPLGRLVHIQVERDGATHDLYVPIVELRGTWADLHPKRTAAVEAHRSANRDHQRTVSQLHSARNEALQLAGKLGFRGVEWGRSYTFLKGESAVFVEVNVVDFQRMLEEIEAARGGS
jgi:hypothetical protein